MRCIQGVPPCFPLSTTRFFHSISANVYGNDNIIYMPGRKVPNNFPKNNNSERFKRKD